MANPLTRSLTLLSLALVSWQAAAGIISAEEYVDDAAFAAATGAVSLTGPLPDIGAQGTSVTLGDATLNAGNTIFVGTGWSTLIPGGNAIAISGVENLDITVNVGAATAFGFYFHEPSNNTGQLNGCNAACVDSDFEIEFYRAGVLLATQTFLPRDFAGGQGFGFGGIILDEVFDELRFREVVGTHDNEFFGEMYVARAVPEPSTLGLLVAGLLGLGFIRRTRAA